MNWLKLWTARAAVALVVILILTGLASTFPADVAFLMAIDLGTWVEAAVAVYVASQVTKVRPLLTFVRARFSKGPRERMRRTRALRMEKSSNDDKPATGHLVAA